MATFEQEISDNLRSLQRQINRIVTARPGPTSYGPLDGHVRLNDGTNDTGYLDFNGFQLRYRGALRGLTDLTESFATSIEAHTVLLGEHDGRLDGHDGDVSRIDAKNAAQDGTLSSHNTRISNAQSRADDAHGDAATAQGRADSAYSRAGTGIANAATAQARADSAYSLASGKADAGDIADLARRISIIEGWRLSVDDILVNLIERVQDLEAAIQP